MTTQPGAQTAADTTGEEPSADVSMFSQDGDEQADRRRFIIEYEPFPGDPHEVQLLTAEELTRFLAENIQHAHYSSDEFKVIGIWRWDGEGDLTLLRMASRSRTTDEDDYIHTTYELYDAADGTNQDRAQPDRELEFTVAIDGRN